MDDTSIPEQQSPSSPPLSPPQPVQDQLSIFTVTSEPIPDNGDVDDGGAVSKVNGGANEEDVVESIAVINGGDDGAVSEVHGGATEEDVVESIVGDNGGVEDGDDGALSEVHGDSTEESVVDTIAGNNGSIEDAVNGAVDVDDGGTTEEVVVEREEVVENVKESSEAPTDNIDGGGAKEEVVIEREVEEEEREKEEREEGSNYNDNDDDDDGNYSKINGNNDKLSSKRSKFPVRPEAEFCSFYVKTGMCKFGMNCKFNHPPDRNAAQVSKLIGNEVAENLKERYYSTQKEGQIDCKYYDRPGGCKFGKACKFNHSRKPSPTSELNFMGLPIRVGEKECPYYMRNGSCKFGPSCRFNHPDPTSNGDHDTFSSYSNGGSISSSATATQSTLKSWSRPAASNESPPYVHMMIPPTQSVPSQPEWTAYPAPVYAPGTGGSVHVAASYATSSKPLEGNIYTHQQDQMGADEFPERPGQPECSYFVRTGTCKYRSACKFHHPKIMPVKSAPYSLSDLGLPLRPGESICSYYSRYGICKYGPACKYDHPINHVPLSAVDLTSSFGSMIVNNQAMAAGS